MHRTVVHLDGSIDLGEQARAAGYAPGAVVDVILTSAGSLIVAPVDESQVLDLPAGKLPAGRERLALVEGRAR